ncbi:hypothetical protein [Alsobacter sp. R-9]
MLVPLMVPSTGGDRGIFVSVAQRLLAGDRLYIDVYDNKEPLFYYFVATQRIGGGVSEFITELILFVTCSFIVNDMMKQAGLGSFRIIVAFAGVPVVLAGAYYIPGGGYLPGVVLALAAASLALRGRAMAAGCLIGVLAFVKILYAPVAAAVVLVFVHGSGAGVTRVIAGVMIATIAACLLLAVRGELIPFIDVIVGNVRYSGNETILQATGFLKSTFAHLTRVDSVSLLMLVGMAVSCAWLGLIWGRRPGESAQAGPAVIALGALSAITAGLGVLAVTAMWNFHFQLLYFGGVLALVAASWPLGLLWERYSWAATFVLLYCAFVLAAGYKPVHVVKRMAEFPAQLRALRTTSPEADALNSLGPPGRYARLGGTDDGRHAWQTERWILQCPRFHQYYFEPAAILERVFDCASGADHLLIGKTLVKKDDEPEAWQRFVDRVEDLVRRNYDCTVVQGVRACRRKTLAS